MMMLRPANKELPGPNPKTLKKRVPTSGAIDATELLKRSLEARTEASQRL